jgi:hypothetical protein
VRRIGVEETAAVAAEELDRLLRCDRSTRDDLCRNFQRARIYWTAKGLRDTLRCEKQSANHTNGQQDVKRGAGEVDPSISDGLAAMAGKAAHHRDRHGHAGCCRKERLDGNTGHLAEIAKGRLSRIGLPTRIRDKAHRGVKSEVRRHWSQMLRIERHRRLESQDCEEQDHAGKVEDEEGYGIVEPVLFTRGINTGQPKKGAFEKS